MGERNRDIIKLLVTGHVLNVLQFRLLPLKQSPILQTCIQAPPSKPSKPIPLALSCPSTNQFDQSWSLSNLLHSIGQQAFGWVYSDQAHRYLY